MGEPRVQTGFKVPPEVSRYFAGRGLKPHFSWLDVWGEEHAYAFTVAKAVDLELLTIIRDSLAKAIGRGEGFETWRKGLMPELARLGWVGKRRVEDPSGQWPSAEVDFSSPRRLRTIFNANMRSARAAGQWERVQQTKDVLPYLLYVRTTSHEQRPQHLAWAGTILPADDPFWRTHFPPNGWECKCAVRQVSKFERTTKLKQDGYSDARPALEARPFINRRTGQVIEVPDGIDPGWAHNPGLARVSTIVKRVDEQLATVGEVEAREVIAEIWRSPLPGIVSKLPESERVQLPVAVSPDLAKAFDARTAVISISRDTLAVKTGDDRARPTDLKTFAMVQELIDEGTVIHRGEPNRRNVFTERDGVWWNTAIGKGASGFMRVVSVHRTRWERVMRWLEKEKDADGRP